MSAFLFTIEMCIMPIALKVKGGDIRKPFVG